MKFITLSGLLLFICGCCSSPEIPILKHADSGRNITLQVGESAAIHLDSNPTTGYTWQLIANNDRVRLTDEQFIAPSTSLVGAPGQYTLTVIAEKPGSAVVTGYNFRPWEKLNFDTDKAVEYHFTILPN